MMESRRVLLVHDQPADFVRVVQALATDLPEVLVVPVTSDEALVSELHTGDFDLVLTREQLTWADGIGILRAVRRQHARCPVILIVASPDADMIEEGLREGLSGAFLTLSNAYSGLSDAVARAWDRPRPRQAQRASRLDEARYTLLAQEASSVTGPEFFRVLVRALAESFGARRAFVSELAGTDPARVRLIAVWSDQDFEEGIEYDLAGTPCETVVGKSRAHYPTGVPSLFPRDEWMKRHGMESYFAEPIFDRAGNALGHFGMMSDKPLYVDPSWDRLLWLFQVRATGELIRRRQEERLSYLLHHDTLTGLPNRMLFLDRLTQALTRANWKRVIVSVMLCDLDRFKLVSDALSQPVADALLQSVGERLATCVRDGDTVARLGSKEFGLLLVDVAAPEHITPIARKVLKTFEPPFLVEGQRISLGANVGISVYPGDGEDAESLLRCAEAATFRATSARHDEYRFYTGAMNAKAASRLRLEEDLRRALERREFLLHYQPLVDLVSGRTTGLEALLRWQTSDRGLVGPSEFIPALEETGLIVAVGEWVLRTACIEKEAWRRAGMAFPRLSVNLSGRQLNDPSLIGTVGRVIEETRIDPQSLELEITESMIQNADVAAGILKDLRAMGVTLAIDDFGTGYSSLSYLKAFPVDTLKIDQSFVRDITTDPNDAAIAKAIIAMAHSLQMRVIAEGVETEAQLAFLSAEQCDEIQGYLFGRPVAASQVGAYLRES
jgi:diguanylate cyclase (GGDEF)-like protein